MNECCRETRNHILARLQQAEKFDARYGLRLPGDSALAVVIGSLEEAKGYEEWDAEPGPEAEGSA